MRLSAWLALCAALLAPPASAEVEAFFRHNDSPSGYSQAQDVRLFNGTGEEWQPTVNYDTTELSLEGEPFDRSVLLRWAIVGVPTNAVVDSAEVVLTLTNDEVYGSFLLREVLKPWVETEATWLQASSGVPWEVPGAQGATDLGAQLGAISPGSAPTLTLTLNAAGRALVQSWVAGAANHGMWLGDYAQTQGVRLKSSESSPGSDRPLLRFTYDGGASLARFREGVFPDGSYAGSEDVVLANGPDPQTVCYDNRGLVGGTNQVSLFRFPLPGIPPWATVTSAELALYVTNVSSSSFPLHALLRGWEEASASFLEARPGEAWEVPGALGATDRGSVELGLVTPSSLGAASFNLNAAGVSEVQRWVEDPTANQGLVMGSYSGEYSQYRDREAGTAANRPGFRVRYVEGALVLTGPARGASGRPAGPIRVLRQRVAGTPLPPEVGPLSVLVAADPTSVELTLDPVSGPWSPTLNVELGAGALASAPLYFRSGQGVATLSASAGPAWVPGALTVTVGEPDEFRVGCGCSSGLDVNACLGLAWSWLCLRSSRTRRSGSAVARSRL